MTKKPLSKLSNGKVSKCRKCLIFHPSSKLSNGKVNPEYSKWYYKHNKDNVLTRTRRYKEKHKIELKRKDRIYQEENKEIIKVKKAERYQINKKKPSYQKKRKEYSKRTKPQRQKRFNNWYWNKSGKQQMRDYRQSIRWEILELIAISWKRNIECFCCGLQEDVKMRTSILEVEHRLPRSILRKINVYFKMATKKLSHKEFLEFYTEKTVDYESMKQLTPLEIKRHFGILCMNCNKQVWLHGTCYIKGHKHWKKSSKWLDKKYNVNEYGKVANRKNKTHSLPICEHHGRLKK